MASESFMFDLTPDQQALVDDFMQNTYPNWKKELDTAGSNLASINTAAAGDWGKQKAMIGAAQTPVNFNIGGGTLATWVPYRTSMGNAIDKESAYKTAAAQAPLAAEQSKMDFYSNTVAPMEKQRMASLGQLGYVEMYNTKTKNSGSFPVSMVPQMEAEGWQKGSPNDVQMKGKYLQDQLDASDPGLSGELTNMMSLVKMGVATWKDLEKSGLIDWAASVIGQDELTDYFDTSGLDVALEDIDFSGWAE